MLRLIKMAICSLAFIFVVCVYAGVTQKTNAGNTGTAACCAKNSACCNKKSACCVNNKKTADIKK